MTLELDLISKPVVVQVSENCPVVRGSQLGTNLTDTSFVQSVGVSISEASLSFWYVVLGSAIVGVQIVANITFTGEVPGRIDTFLIAASISVKTFIDVLTRGSATSIDLQFHAGSGLKVDNVESDVSGLDRVGQNHG